MTDLRSPWVPEPSQVVHWVCNKLGFQIMLLDGWTENALGTVKMRFLAFFAHFGLKTAQVLCPKGLQGVPTLAISQSCPT